MILAIITPYPIRLANWHSFISPTFCSSDPPQKPIHTPIHSNPWFLSSVYPRLCRFSARRSGTFSFGFSKILGLRAKSVTFLVMWGNHLQALMQLCTDFCDGYTEFSPAFLSDLFWIGSKVTCEVILVTDSSVTLNKGMQGALYESHEALIYPLTEENLPANRSTSQDYTY